LSCIFEDPPKVLNLKIAFLIDQNTAGPVPVTIFRTKRLPEDLEVVFACPAGRIVDIDDRDEIVSRGGLLDHVYFLTAAPQPGDAYEHRRIRERSRKAINAVGHFAPGDRPVFDRISFDHQMEPAIDHSPPKEFSLCLGEAVRGKNANDKKDCDIE
jgi:hypothetical protein